MAEPGRFHRWRGRGVRAACWALAGVLLLTAAPAALAQDDEAPDMLRVALTGKYPPFSYYDSQGTLTGFDVDVSREIAERLGREVRFVPTEWDSILGGLLSGKYDAIIGSMAITPNRAEKVNFSRPYYRSGAQLFVHRDNPYKIYSIRECQQRKIAAVLGETYQRYLETQHPDVDVRTYKGTPEIFEMLQQRRIAGFVSDDLVGRWQIRSAGRDFVPVGRMLYTEEMAIPVRKEDTALLAEINRALKAMEEDGTMDAIHHRYFGTGKTAADEGEMSLGVIARKLLTGFAKTLSIAAVALSVGFVLAVPCGLVLNSDRGVMAVVKWPLRTVVDFLRGTPVLIQLLFAWWGLGLPSYVAAAGTLGVNAMAYMAEVVRSGLMSVDRGQVMACRALGLSRGQAFFAVIWPQAFRIAMPSLMNSVVALTKDTALVSVVAVTEVVSQAQSIISATWEPRKYYFIVAVMFFAVTFPLMKAASYLEIRIKRRGFAHD